MRVLIIEDDKQISQLLASFLEEKGYEILCAQEGRQANAMLKNEVYDMVLMDLMLPFIPGEELIKRLRQFSDVPVIVLSAKSMKETKLEMLRIGADDYILKPFDLDEVLVRMEVVLRRADAGKIAPMELITAGGLTMDTMQMRVIYQEKEIALTAKEFQLLKLFMENPKKTFSKANLYEAVWDDVYYYEDNTINVHMSNLRGKLKKAIGEELIETVWGIGYRFKEESI